MAVTVFAQVNSKGELQVTKTKDNKLDSTEFKEYNTEDLKLMVENCVKIVDLLVHTSFGNCIENEAIMDFWLLNFGSNYQVKRETYRLSLM